MKKILSILLLTLLFSCQKDYIDEIVAVNFFDSTEQLVSNNQEIQFTLSNNGTYSLVLVGINGNLIARERFNGVKGSNKRTVYVSLLTDMTEVYLMLYNSSGIKLEEVLLKIN